MSLKEKYREAICDVQMSEAFRRETVQLMKQAAKRKEAQTMKMKSIKIIAVAAVLVLTLSLSAFAISNLLSAREVAESLGKGDIADMFEGSKIKPQAIVGEEYTVNLLGIVSGKDLEDTDADIDNSHSYAVLSIEKNDGSDLALIDGMPLQMAPVADGMRPGELWSMGMSASGMEKDGILYYLFDYTDLEVYADSNISIAVFEGDFPTADILVMNEKGVTEYAEGYMGFKGIFRLDIG